MIGRLEIRRNGTERINGQMGSLYLRKGSRNWMMGLKIDGRQICKSSRESDKELARQKLEEWRNELDQGGCHVGRCQVKSFSEWANEFLEMEPHPNTRKRYGSSISKLRKRFGSLTLPEIDARAIKSFKKSRGSEGVEAATINHDLRVLRKMLRLAQMEGLISRNPFSRFPFPQVEFLKQRAPRMPHIVTVQEEEKILTTFRRKNER